ncbi:MAG: hypothetical protein R6U10_05990, partial [Thermoplasmatota archaeon]
KNSTASTPGCSPMQGNRRTIDGPYIMNMVSLDISNHTGSQMSAGRLDAIAGRYGHRFISLHVPDDVSLRTLFSVPWHPSAGNDI